MGYGAPQSLGMICERMLKWFLHKWLPEFPVDKLVMGLTSYSHERLAAAQHIGRQIWEAPVRKALETKPMGEVIPFLLSQNEGKVFIHGELWNAKAQEEIGENTKVRVVNVVNLMLEVEPAEEPSSA